MTFGNILIGGLIGVVIDASTGAMLKYSDSVTFVLVPVEFATASDRDPVIGGEGTGAHGEMASGLILAYP